MATVLPRLRTELELIPSPLPEQPGVLVRDPYRYSDVTLVVPPLLARCLALFDGAHTEVDLRELLGRLTGRSDRGDEVTEAMCRALSEAGFVVDARFRQLQARRHREFAAARSRPAAYAGGGYPDDPVELARTLDEWRTTTASRRRLPGSRLVRREGVVGVAAPHASPSAAVATYAAAYAALPDDAAERTFVVLGTSHYGAPARFGLTRKPFETPLGRTRTDEGLVSELEAAAPEAFVVEDYCHAVEHSIEFQVLFLQSRFGPEVRVLPILCGPFLASPPERDPAVARGIAALAALDAAHRDRLTWVLGVDMAHMGPRYGDRAQARAHEGQMTEVAARDHERLARVSEGDAGGFWRLVEGGAGGGTVGDDLKWCGSAPLYAYLRAVPDVRGQVLDYDHWNIDDGSVVSFAALAFERRAAR